MKKLTHMNFVYTSVGIWLLAIAVSCSCKNNQNRPKKDKSHNTPTQDRSNNTNDIEKPGPAHILLTSDKNNLSRDEKAFQILLDNQTETPANLAEYKFKISLQEEGGKGSTLRYKDASNQPHTKSNIEEPLSHFISQTTLKKGDKTITLPFEIHNKVGVTRITFIVTLEHTDKQDTISPIKIVWEGLTPIIDEMIQQAKEKKLYFLAEILTNLQKGISVDINSLDRFTFIIRDTALHQAIKLNNIDIVKVLLERGAESTKKNNAEQTPLELAISRNMTGITKLLIGELNGQQLHTKDTFGELLLNTAIRNNNIEMFKVLIEEMDASQLNEKNAVGNTVLHIAASDNNFEIVKELLAKGANKTIKNNDGKAPFDLARTSEMEDLLKF